MIIISTIAALFLRIFKIFDNYYFTGELGKELLYVWQLVHEGKFPLVGLATSHEWLTYGPIYYWILIPLVKIFGWSPFILYWLALAVSIVGILLTYFVFKKIVNKRFAVILSFFVSLSPLWIWATRLSKLHTFFFILMPLVIFFLYKIWNGKIKYMFWLGLTYGLIFSFHYSQIPIFLVLILAFWIKRKTIRKIKNYLLFTVGIILPNITVLIYDFQNNLAMFKNMILWIPYRFAGFFGLYPKDRLLDSSGLGTIGSFNQFFGMNLFWDNRFWFLGSIVFVVLFIIFTVQNSKKISKDFLTFYLISSTVIQCGALFVHTSPPLHYFFPIFLNFGLIFSYFVDINWQKKSTKILTVLIFILLFAATILDLENEHVKDFDYIPLSIQNKVANEIVKDADGRPFSLSRIGPFDYFPENYSQNYKFLIIYDGGTIDPSSKLNYVIIENNHDATVAKNE